MIYYTPTDISNFELCRCHVINKIRKTKGDEGIEEKTSKQIIEYQKQGYELENKYLDIIKKKFSVTDISEFDFKIKHQETIDAIERGDEYIYQPYLEKKNIRGFPDFLKKVKVPSKLGDFSYEVVDVKRSKDPKQVNITQLLVYCYMIEDVQGVMPTNINLINGSDFDENIFEVKHFYSQFIESKKDFFNFVSSIENKTIDQLKSLVFDVCEYNTIYNGKACETVPPALDLVNVVDLTKKQKNKILNYAANIEELASFKPTAIKGINDLVLLKLIEQAKIQFEKIKTKKPSYKLLPTLPSRGFNILPKKDKNDLFFDIEGDPTVEGGHEYLFGLINGSKKQFKSFWAKLPSEEEAAFRELMDFFKNHFLKNPDAHIYHYNHYEVTALRKLTNKYDTKNEILDYLLRNEKFVDLYKVVKQGVITSETGRSIKDLEIFYMKQRESNISTGEDSVEKFIEWKETGNNKILEDIESYNKEDCVSTQLLLDWLHSIKPSDSILYEIPEKVELDESNTNEIKETKKVLMRNKNSPNNINQLISDILEFHVRENKSDWWLFFDRKVKDHNELLEDMNAIAECTKKNYYHDEKGYPILELQYPEQDFKISEGNQVINLDAPNIETIGTLTNVNFKDKSITVRGRGKNRPLEEISLGFNLGSDTPIPVNKLRTALYNFVRNYTTSNNFKSILSLLNNEAPRFKGSFKLTNANKSDTAKLAYDAISNLDNSYIFIQGPPGTGKTFTAAKVISQLLKDGNKIAITSNSHKAIIQLLSTIDEVTDANFKGLKIFSQSSKGSFYESDNIDAKNQPRPYKKGSKQPLAFFSGNYQLYACTKFQLSEQDLEQEFDYLFIDEAGQVSIADTIISSMVAKNLVLIGDPQQLSQPSSILHPGDSGLSVLQYILRNENTISNEKGIFINETRRMNEKINSFISSTFYDDRLKAHSSTYERKLVFKDKYLKISEGILLVEMDHQFNSQSSEEELLIIKKIYNYLLKQKISVQTKERALNKEDILVVAPYNLQVNRLTQGLPEGNRTGTIDKFQGQEAAISILSMTASDTEEAPRGIEFLFDYRRLNVAISRAQCLSIIVMNKGLYRSRARNIKQIQMANNFQRLRNHATIVNGIDL